jgi:hypothetical protein
MPDMSKMLTSLTTNTSGKGSSRLLTLPSELRNAIYEYVLADVQDNVCIDLVGGDNKVHKVKAKEPRTVSKEERTSRLSLLLTCRQINDEASGIAYSKMSMSLDTVFATPEDFNTRANEAFKEGGERLGNIMHHFTKTFLGQNLACIPHMQFPSTEVLIHLTTFNSPAMDVQRYTDFCTDKCASLSRWQGVVHNLFHKVRRITITGEDRSMERLYRSLTKGASWLSITMQPHEVREVLGVFSNLEEIVVRRQCGEQVSKVIDGKLYAVKSGMEMRGLED